MKKENEILEDKLVEFLQDAEGNALDVFYDVYEQFLKDSKSPQTLLPVIFEFTGRIGSREEKSVKVSDEIQNEIEKHLPEVKDIATKIAQENQTSDVFYSNLWKELFISSSFSQSSEQCAALLGMLHKDILVLPYYQAFDLYHMEESEFKASLERIRSRIVESTHMLNRHFKQKTETTSQLCRIAKDLSQEDTYVYWATMISLIEKSSHRAGYSRAFSEIKRKLDADVEDE